MDDFHLPYGWVRKLSKSTGQEYFMNVFTNESQWTLPQLMGSQQPFRPPPPQHYIRLPRRMRHSLPVPPAPHHFAIPAVPPPPPVHYQIRREPPLILPPSLPLPSLPPPSLSIPSLPPPSLPLRSLPPRSLPPSPLPPSSLPPSSLPLSSLPPSSLRPLSSLPPSSLRPLSSLPPSSLRPLSSLPPSSLCPPSLPSSLFAMPPPPPPLPPPLPPPPPPPPLPSENANSDHEKNNIKIRCSHLLIKHKNSRRPSSWKNVPITRNEDEALSLILEYRRRLVQGKYSFSYLSSTYSDCSSARREGDLGPFSRGNMQPKFEEMAFTLKIGELSHPVYTDSGIHLILRTG